MAQITIKGETVYECDVCNRRTRVATSSEGIDVVQRCIITKECTGKLHKVTDIRDINATSSFPPEVAGVQDWFQRRVLYNHTQNIKSSTWTIQHNLQNKPVVYVYTTKQTTAATSFISNAAVGQTMYKSDNSTSSVAGYPSAAGLYKFNGTTWVSVNGIIPQGILQSSNIFQYLQLNQNYPFSVIDNNTISVSFDDPQSGLVQCVTSASQVNEIVSVASTTVSDIQITHNGELTLATKNSGSVIAVAINLKSAVLSRGVDVVYPGVDSVPSVNSPWVGTKSIFVNNNTYTVRSFDIISVNLSGVMASGVVDPTHAQLSFTNFSSDVGQNYILLGKLPYGATDRLYDQYIDIASLSKVNPQIYYKDGEMYVTANVVTSPFPYIQVSAHQLATSVDTSQANTVYWISEVGTTASATGNAIAATSDIYSLGFTPKTTSLYGGDLVIHYDQSGTIQHQVYFESTVASTTSSRSISAQNDIVVVVVNSESGIVVSCMDGDCVILWQRTIGGCWISSNTACSVSQAKSIYITGHDVTNTLSYVLKINSTGSIVWQRQLAIVNNSSVATDGSDNVYVVGDIVTTVSNAYVMCINASGNAVWQRSVGGQYETHGATVVVGSDGSTYLCGSISGIGSGHDDAFIVKYDNQGTSLWQRAIGGAASDAATDLCIDANDTLYFVGRTNSQGAGSYDVSVVKLDSSGNVVWQRSLGNTSSSSTDVGNTIAIDAYGNLVVCGTSGIDITSSMVAKLSSVGTGVGTYGSFVYRPVSLVVTTLATPIAIVNRSIQPSNCTVNSANVLPNTANLDNNLTIL